MDDNLLIGLFLLLLFTPILYLSIWNYRVLLLCSLFRAFMYWGHHFYRIPASRLGSIAGSLTGVILGIFAIEIKFQIIDEKLRAIIFLMLGAFILYSFLYDLSIRKKTSRLRNSVNNLQFRNRLKHDKF